MPFNGTGTFSRVMNWVNDAAAAINITASRVDTDTQDIANGLSLCITRDGQGKPSAAIDWNLQNLLNVGKLTAAGATTIGDTNGNSAFGTAAPTNIGSGYRNVMAVGSAGGAGGVWRTQSSDGIVYGDFYCVAVGGVPGGTSVVYMGSQTVTPVVFLMGGSGRLRIDTSGNFLPEQNNTYTNGSSAGRWSNVFSVLGNFSGAVQAAGVNVTSSTLGYGVGAGGVITQATNKATGVTLNTGAGQITMNGAALASAAVVSFTFTNSQIAATDTVVFSIASAGTAGAYLVMVDQTAAGSCRVSVRNLSAGSLSEALVLNFAIVKGAAS